MIAANDDGPGAARALLALKIVVGLTALLLAWAFVFLADAYGTERSKQAIRDFRKEHPCPATGKSMGACSGYVIDHIKPLCAGGPDHPSNMQWQTVQAAKVKDREERKQCSAIRKTRALN